MQTQRSFHANTATLPPPKQSNLSRTEQGSLRSLFGGALTPFLGSALLGLIVLGNQFGEALAHFINIAWLSPLWEVNAVTKEWGVGAIFLLVTTLLFLHYVVWRSHSIAHYRQSFWQGLGTGFTAIPAITLSIGAIAAVLWLLWQILRIVVVVIAWIAGIVMWLLTPITWLLTWIGRNIIIPVLSFLAIPFVWLWHHVLYPVLAFLAIPLVWIGQKILLPLLSLLLKFVLRPVGILLAGILGGLLALYPFAVIGKVIEESFRTATSKKIDSVNAFIYGVGLGFTLFDIAASLMLHVMGYISYYPAISHYVLLLAPAVFVVRLQQATKATLPSSPPLPYAARVQAYWSESKMEVLSMAVVIPVGIVLAILSKDER